jgi:hypothetical protein
MTAIVKHLAIAASLVAISQLTLDEIAGLVRKLRPTRSCDTSAPEPAAPAVAVHREIAAIIWSTR